MLNATLTNLESLDDVHTDMSRCTRLRYARKHDIADNFRAMDPCLPIELRFYAPEFMINRTLFVLPTSPV